MWKPKKWNQGGYDAFYVFADSKAKAEDTGMVNIWFFQVTRGSSHELKLKFFVEVVELFRAAGLNVSDCEVFFVIPEGNSTRVSSVTPHGTMFNDEFGWARGQEAEHVRVVRMKKTTVTA